ncbi:glycine receptor subunit alpha-2-like [Mya arenaria]|uniref:glycine receptor subunit alpha-2-like n=1 Tax=Mya arenaria TaxID=6604 RepID=UPI0022E0829D|nr:glycine receptor subunit alpha-2-like [Mya arenaria]XP_052795373.1 glycine receptor subunit alpha-2-like [Mya arenaria]
MRVNKAMPWALVIGMTFLSTMGSAQSNVTRKQLINDLLEDYDANVIPDLDSDYPTNVTVQLSIHNMHSISETTMEYSVDALLRTWWRDHRLDFTSIKTNFTSVELDTKLMDRIWQPDIYFKNEKRGLVHTITTTNKLMHINMNGTVVLSIRLTVALSCSMNLQYYPFDSQTCPLYLGSFGYTDANINLDWRKQDPVHIKENEMPKFDLRSEVELQDYISQAITGSFSTLRVDFFLDRQIGFFWLQIFIPSLLLVVLSWVSFWVDPKAVPARVSLGVTCVLTLTTQSSGTRQLLPPVSYVKAIDVWMFVCLVFVFAALLEFAYVNVLGRAKEGTETEENETESKCCTRYKAVCFKVFAEAGEARAKKVDIISRALFPGVFCIFLSVFFLACGLAS